MEGATDMKKVLVVLCSLALVITCSLLVPATAHAGDRDCQHVYNATVETQEFDYLYESHQYLDYNGQNGPVYGTCVITVKRVILHPRCTLCGYIDTSVNYYRVISRTHSVVH